ncbi:hypothetical protein RND81_04G057200 [Saponaria officinalis]|uniref:Uncharacterized protein n=1 Tax=Saponaria officinalis TaxID=3572 RepID=A0AAW1LF50_SAPOF
MAIDLLILPHTFTPSSLFHFIAFFTHSICHLLKFSLIMFSMFLYMLYVCCTPLFASSKFFPGHIPSTAAFEPESCTTILLDVETFWVYNDNKQAIHPSGDFVEEPW